MAEIKKHLAGFLEVKAAVSGMHIIGWLPEGVDDKLVAERAARASVKMGTISGNSLTRPPRSGLILGYTAINDKQIKKGVKQLAKVVKESGEK